MLLTFNTEVFKSKIIWVPSVGVGAESSIIHQKKTEPILKNKDIQLPLKKQLSS